MRCTKGYPYKLFWPTSFKKLTLKSSLVGSLRSIAGERGAWGNQKVMCRCNEDRIANIPKFKAWRISQREKGKETSNWQVSLNFNSHGSCWTNDVRKLSRWMRMRWYAPWSLLSVGESSCRRKNLTSCFRGPHFWRWSYIMCSKGIARSTETERLQRNTH